MDNWDIGKLLQEIYSLSTLGLSKNRLWEWRGVPEFSKLHSQIENIYGIDVEKNNTRVY